MQYSRGLWFQQL